MIRQKAPSDPNDSARFAPGTSQLLKNTETQTRPETITMVTKDSEGKIQKKEGAGEEEFQLFLRKYQTTFYWLII